MVGVVLCGGKSTRMGTDKGLILKDHLTWSEKAFLKLASLSVPILVSVNQDQKQQYEKIFSPELLVIDSFALGGPLNGILSAHQDSPNQDLIVLACDMVNVENSLLQQLYDTYLSCQRNYDYFVYKNQGHYEPLCGIYSSRGLSKIVDDIHNGAGVRYSMKSILENGSTLSLELPEQDAHQFTNFNEPAIITKSLRTSSPQTS